MPQEPKESWKTKLRDWWYKQQDAGYELPESGRVELETMFRQAISTALTQREKEIEECFEKSFEKTMGCIPECANGLYEDVGCPAHGYDAIKVRKLVLSLIRKH